MQVLVRFPCPLLVASMLSPGMRYNPIETYARATFRTIPRSLEI